MTLIPRLLAVSLSIVLVLALALPAVAQPRASYVTDDAQVFSVEAIGDANLMIETVLEKTHVPFYVRTVKTLPAEVLKQLDRKPYREQALALQAHALELANKAGQVGIHVLVTEVPNYKLVVAVINSESVEKLVSKSDLESVRTIFARGMAKKPDQALADGVDKVQQILYNRSSGTTIDWKVIGSLVFGFLGLWLLLGLFRMKTQDPDQPCAAEGTARRNSLASGLLGGMFGTVAGHWIYDHLFNRGRPEETPPTTPTPPTETRR